MKFILKIVFSALVAFVLSRYLPGIHMESFWTALGFALVLSLLNFFIRPLLIILTLPITIFTLGLFILILNALMVWMASGLISGFHIDHFSHAILFSLLYSFISFILFSGSNNKS
jgi:putative membrane protein